LNTKENLAKATEEVLILLEKSKQRVDQSIDSLPGIYFVMDAEGLLLRTNNELNRLLATYPSEKIFIWDLVEAESESIFRNKLKVAMADQETPVHCEVKIKDAKSVWGDYSLTLFAWELGQVSGVPKVFFTVHGKDVSELRKVSNEKQDLQQEIIGAEQLQQLMVPNKERYEKHFDLSCFYQPASNCGGDFLHYSLEDERLRIWAGDVTGHGVGSAMVSGATRAAVAIIEQNSKKVSVIDAMEQLNRCIIDVTHGAYWVTFQIVEFDFAAKIIHLCQAGHEDVFCLQSSDFTKSKATDFASLVMPPSPHVGKSLDSKFTVKEFPLEKNSLYLCATDGVVETRDKNGTMFNHRRMLRSYLNGLIEAQSLTGGQEQLMNDLAKFRDYGPMEDDMSLWAVFTK
jgi:serine phosphatase RsbU (regulator of sigma subunit)